MGTATAKSSADIRNPGVGSNSSIVRILITEDRKITGVDSRIRSVGRINIRSVGNSPSKDSKTGSAGNSPDENDLFGFKTSMSSLTEQ